MIQIVQTTEFLKITGGGKSLFYNQQQIPGFLVIVFTWKSKRDKHAELTFYEVFCIHSLPKHLTSIGWMAFRAVFLEDNLAAFK